MSQHVSDKTNTRRTAYHHGDLRSALLIAAQEELAASNVEKLSLRSVAKRAGVSHAAPAHHFKDKRGLLTSLAALGFERFLKAQEARQAATPDKSPRAQLSAAGLGYVDFASGQPELFNLMFASSQPDFSQAELCEPAEAAIGPLARCVAQIHGHDPFASDKGYIALAHGWALAHGLAALLIHGRLKKLGNKPVAEREAMVLAIFDRIAL
jgi:AcrR family transcriptional regulator